VLKLEKNLRFATTLLYATTLGIASPALANHTPGHVELKVEKAPKDPGKLKVAKPLEAGRITALKASISPENFSGICPAKFTYTVEVSVDKPGWIQYKFTRSDGATQPPKPSVYVDTTKKIKNTWTLGGASKPSYSGWMSVEFLKGIPKDASPSLSKAFAEAAKKNFKLNCTNTSIKSSTIPEKMDKTAPVKRDSAPVKRQMR